MCIYYATTINKVEEITGTDFFPFLPDDEEEIIEEHIPDKFRIQPAASIQREK